MYDGGSQDADRLLTGNLSSCRCCCVEERNQSADRQQQHRRSPLPPPHCVTCCCLSAGTIKCRLPPSAGRCGSEQQRQRPEEVEIPLDYNGEDYTGAAKPRRRRRRVAGTTSSAVDEILREMSLCTSVVISDDEIDIGPRRESEEDSDSRRQQQQQSNVGATVTRIRSCERWPVRKRDDEKDEDKAPTGTETVPIIEPASLNAATAIPPLSPPPSTYRADKWPATQRRRRRDLLGAGDGEKNSPLALDLNADDALITAESSSSLKDLVTGGGASELRQVRRQFIERICQEARKLRRLQRQLDDCAAPSPLPRRTRSISTMTSSRDKRESCG